MNNLERAVEFYARTSGRYARRRPHGIREPVLAWQRKGIVELAAPRTTDSVLDVGCGAGQIAALLRPMVASICGVDASKEMVALARRWLDEEAHASLEPLHLGPPARSRRGLWPALHRCSQAAGRKRRSPAAALTARAPGRTAARSATARIRAQSRPSGPRTRS